MTAPKKATSAAPVTAPAVAEVPTEAVVATLAATDADATVQTVVVTDPDAAGTTLPAELADDAKPLAALPEPEFPVEVTLSNNGGFAVSEPVSGAFLPAGGSQTVWLHDAAHASRVLDNLRELALRHQLNGVLLVNGLPLGAD